MEAKDLDATLARAREIAKGPELDSMTIKELKVALKPSKETLLNNNQKASIVTVVILIVDT